MPRTKEQIQTDIDEIETRQGDDLAELQTLVIELELADESPTIQTAITNLRSAQSACKQAQETKREANEALRVARLAEIS